MAEENQLAGNLLQTQEEADRKAEAMGVQPKSQQQTLQQPVYNPLTGISRRQFYQIMAGNDPKRPIVTTDQFGIPQFHFENAGQTGAAKVSVNVYGTPTVSGMAEAMQNNAEQLKQDLTAFHASFAPELMRDKTRSSYFNELLQGAGTFVGEAGKSAGSIVMESAHGILAQKRNYLEAKWNAVVNANKDNPNFQLAGQKVQEWEDAGYDNESIGFMPVGDMDVPEETKDFLRQYQKLVGERMADERRMRVSMAYEEDKTNLERFMQGQPLLEKKEGDEDTTINTIAKMSGQVAGSVAVFYLTGRIAGITGASIGRAKNLISGANAAQKARNAVALAQAGGTDAFLTAAATIGERSVFLPSFLSQYNSIRTQSLIAGKSLAEANAIGFVAGVAEGATEMLGFKWGRRFYSDGGWFKNYILRNILPESIQEGVQTTFENIITQATGVSDKQWEDIMTEIGLSIIAGAIGGGMFSFWRAKELGLEAKVADIAEDLGNKWGNLTKQQISEVVDTTHAAMQAAEKEGKDTANPEVVFSEQVKEAKAEQPAAPQPSEEQLQEQSAVGKDIVTTAGTWTKARPEGAGESWTPSPTPTSALKTFSQLSKEQQTAAKAYLEAVNQLKEHYTNRVKEINPNVTEQQLRNGWNHVRAQVLAQKNGNMLVATYESAINQAVAYLKPDSKLIQSNAKEVSDGLFAAGYTQEQISAVTSPDAIKAHDAKWQIAWNFVKDECIRSGISENEATAIANTIKFLAYDSSLVSPSSDPQAIVEKITQNLINVQIAILHGQQLPGIFYNILKQMDVSTSNPEEVRQIASSTVQSLNKKKRTASDNEEVAVMLFGDSEDADKKVDALNNSISAQAELVAEVLKHMPLSRTAIDQTEAKTMVLMRAMGLSWDTIIPMFGIKSNVEVSFNESFENTAEKYFPKLNEQKMQHLEEMDSFSREDEIVEEEGQEEQPTRFLPEVDENVEDDAILLYSELKSQGVPKKAWKGYFAQLGIGSAQMKSLVSQLEQTKERQPAAKTQSDSSKPAYDEGTIEKIKYGTGFYEADQGIAVLTNPKTGTALHEVGVHLSLSYLVTSATELEKAGLLRDLSPIHRIYAYLRQAAQSEGLELTQQQLQETLNDALNDFIVNGQSDDPVVTGLLNEFRVQHIERYKRLLNSKYGQEGGKGGMSKGQKAIMRSNAATMLSGQTPGTVLADAYKLQEETNLSNKEFDTIDKNGLRKIGESILEFSWKHITDVSPTVELVNSMVENGDLLGLVSLANYMSNQAIEIATSAFVEAKSYSTEGELNRAGGDQIFFEAEAGVLPMPKRFKSSFGKEKTIIESFKDVEFSKTGEIFSSAAKAIFQSVEGAAGEFDDALAKRGIKGAKRGELRSIIMMPFYQYGRNIQAFRETAKEWADASDAYFKKLKGARYTTEVLQWYSNFMLPLRQGKKGAYKKAGDFLESRLGKKARESFDNSIAKLKEAEQMMIAAGVDAKLFAVGGDFFPFAVKNFDKFVREFLGYSHAFSNTEKERSRFINEYKKKHPEETPENIERLYVALVDNQNSLFQRNADNETKVTAFHHRNIAMADDEDPRIFEYYEDPVDTLDNYMEAAYRTVMMRQLIGKVTYSEDGKPILATNPKAMGQVGAYLMRVPEGAVSKEIQDNLIDKLRSLASRDAGDRNTLFDIVRQVNQCTTLGSFFNAINQTMDIPFILSMYGLENTKAALEDMCSKAGKSLTLEDVGAETSNEVFRVRKEDVLGKINKGVFKWSGFAWTDKKIKELALNAAAKWAQDVLKVQNTGRTSAVLENSQRYAELKYVIDECFPEFDKTMLPPLMKEGVASTAASLREQRRKLLMEALARGGKNGDGTWNEDAKFVYWYMLTKLQPINAATVNAMYNKSGAVGKNFFQFTTVAMRQLGFLSDYWKMKWRTGGSKQAAVGMLKFVAYCMAIGIPKEILEAILKGREPDVGGAFVMSPFHVFMLNEYSLALAKKEGIASAAFKTYGGKFPVLDNVSKDFFAVISGKDFKFNTSKNIPLIGPFGYAWLFGGREQTLRQDRDLFGEKLDPIKARQQRELNRQKARSIEWLETSF